MFLAALIAIKILYALLTSSMWATCHVGVIVVNLFLNSWNWQSFRLSLYIIFPYFPRQPTVSASFCFITWILFWYLFVNHSIPKSNPPPAVINFIFLVALFFMSTNYENQCKMFGQTIVACYRFKSCCATRCKTPSVSSTVSHILQAVVTELLHIIFSLCSRHLALRYLQSAFSASFSYTSSACFLGTLLSDTFNLRFQHLVLTHLQSVFSASCTDPCLIVLSATTSQKLSKCVLRNLFSQVLKYVLSAPSSFTLPICSKHRISGYIVLWQCLYLHVSIQYDARLVKIALVSDVWNASVSTYIAVYMSALLRTDTSTYLTAHAITYPPTHPPTYIHQPIHWSP